jgi:hypothetical protein
MVASSSTRKGARLTKIHPKGFAELDVPARETIASTATRRAEI